ncbi:tetratricopeptide repeat protein [Kamptonema formosum]|uniref:tetratricopeptide repeat protein n=1 Tax=Kamptonema formosum TaxID=331992 RepID=UPI0003454177|nr:tetratricopeptide repeat protein [Oscillatoria sp. PCC 10802]
MTDSTSLPERYLAIIDQIVETTLKGQIRSKDQVYQMLARGVSPGTGEIFERCLQDRLSATENQLKAEKDELKQARANRTLRALKTVEGEYARWQKENRVSSAIASAAQQILTASPADRLSALLRAIDPNQQHPLTLEQIQQLAKALHQQLQQITNPDLERDLQQLLAGITKGLESWHRLEPHLVSWIYDQSQGQLGFEGVPGQRGPWALWAKQVNSPFPQALFNTIALDQSIIELVSQRSDLDLSVAVELAVVLQCLQRGLVTWFDRLVYDSQAGAKLSISTFLTFALIWCVLANGFSAAASLNGSNRERLADGCFQLTLQILRAFSQRDYFPLYGGIFASFSGRYLRDTLDYLNEPLRRVEGTQEKARILTLLGYSHRAQGLYEQAISFHEQALDIARNAGDRPCEIANLNHLSRTFVAQKNYAGAINSSQRALILARQTGDRLGEANALANLGYSEVFQARQLEQVEPEVYEAAVGYLQQGLQLSERLGDRQSQALCGSSLGIACVLLDQPSAAIEYLVKGWQAAQISGDLYLQGLNMAYLAEAYYSQQDIEKTAHTGALAMYLLEQISAAEWRKSAGLLTILQGQMGADAFQKLLGQQRAKIIPFIGVDGYDYIPQLLDQYRRSLE